MKQKGFTLIELMVVISITAILGVLGIAGFVNYNQTQVLQFSANEVVNMLNLAKSRAQSQVKLGDSCGTHTFLEGYRVDIISNDNDSYVLNSLCSGVLSPLETKTLPSSLSFDADNSFFFPIQTGGVEAPGQIVIDSDGRTKTITVNSLGGVSVE